MELYNHARFRPSAEAADAGMRRRSVIRWGSISPVLDESWPVRYRFESLGAFQRHLRLGPGFFLPDVDLPGGPGSRVIVEVVVPETSDHPVLHGRVRERGTDGVWLELPSARPAARWEPDPEGPRRRHRRLPCALFAEVRPRGAEPWLCRALDLSESGLRVATGFETGIRGDDVSATLISPDSDLSPAKLRGRVVWAASRETGIEVIERSAEFEKLLAAAAARWDLVDELEHSATCACAQRESATGQRQP